MSLTIIRGDILKMKVDAIVNPTDPYLSGSDGIDSKIHSLGKKKLMAELSPIGVCGVGDAILTRAYGLPCRYVIHTVVPASMDDANALGAIENCYINSLDLASSQDIESIAFPLLATGVSVKSAIQIAINTIIACLLEYDTDVYLVVRNSEELGITKELIDDVRSYVEADNTADECAESIQKLLSIYELNEVPLPERSFGEIRVSAAIEPVFKSCAIMGVPFREDDSFEDLIPELDKIKRTNEDSFTYKLFKIIDDNKLKDSDVYNAAGISKMVFSNLRKGVIPKKKTVLQLCLALPINLEQATELLASAGYTFILSDKFEKTIKRIIEAKNTSKLTRIDVIDLILYELGLPVFNSAP